MSYSTYNGWNIIPVPSTPAVKEVTFRQNDSVGVTQSPFTMQSQVQYWPGADWWEMDVTLPPMTDQQARIWFAWFGSLRGRANVFQMGDPLMARPYGAVSTVPHFNGTVIPGQTVLAVNNLTASTNNIFYPGDLLQFGYYMHMVAGPGPYNSDSSGNVAALEVWPSVRNTNTSGASININNVAGLWRLTENKRSYNIIANEPLWTLSFKAIEAR